jgi:phage terminase large subunit-like protein
VIKNSTGAREQPLILYITTAGYQLDGPLIDYYSKGTDVLEGVIEDERSFYFIAEIDKEDDIEDPKNWIKANPNIGITLDLDTLIEEWNSRKHIPAERNDFITKRLNVFVKSDEQSFLDYEVIERNNKTMDIKELEGMPCIGGFDLSQTEDFTSACLEFWLDTGEIFVLSHSWIPRKKVIVNNEKIPYYYEWEKEELLTICESDYVEYEKVLEWFIEQSKRFRIELITYDPANAYRLVKDLEHHGFKTEVVRQGAITLSPALKDVKELFLDGKVIFNNNRLFRWYINNVKLVEDRNGNWLPTKQNRYRKIDGFAAFLNAHTEVMKRMTAPKGDGNISVLSLSDLLK